MSDNEGNFSPQWSVPFWNDHKSGEVRIDHINLQKQQVVIANPVSAPDLDLTGWALCDQQMKNKFYFPNGFILYSGSDVTIHCSPACLTPAQRSELTEPGHLFWKNNDGTLRMEPAFKTDGDNVVLLDANGQSTASHHARKYAYSSPHIPNLSHVPKLRRRKSIVSQIDPTIPQAELDPSEEEYVATIPTSGSLSPTDIHIILRFLLSAPMRIIYSRIFFVIITFSDPLHSPYRVVLGVVSCLLLEIAYNAFVCREWDLLQSYLENENLGLVHSCGEQGEEASTQLQHIPILFPHILWHISSALSQSLHLGLLLVLSYLYSTHCVVFLGLAVFALISDNAKQSSQVTIHARHQISANASVPFLSRCEASQISAESPGQLFYLLPNTPLSPQLILRSTSTLFLLFLYLLQFSAGTVLPPAIEGIFRVVRPQPSLTADPQPLTSHALIAYALLPFFVFEHIIRFFRWFVSISLLLRVDVRDIQVIHDFEPSRS